MPKEFIAMMVMWLAGTVAVGVLGYRAGLKDSADGRASGTRDRARKAMEELANSLLAYWQRLPESQLKSHERSLVGALQMIVSHHSVPVGKDGFEWLTDLATRLKEYIDARKEGRVQS